MPSAQPLPTIAELIGAFNDAVRGEQETLANVRTGSVYNHFAGIGAILFAREASRDRDLFRSIYFDTAEGGSLTRLGEQRFSIERALDSYGTGEAVLARPSAAAGADSIWAGTHIRAASLSGRSTSRVYVVTADTPYGASATSVRVPVRAAEMGSGWAIQATRDDAGLRLVVDDELSDPTWTVQTLTCADGTDFEEATAYRARVRQQRLAARVGYLARILSRLADDGAVNAVGFPSNYTGDDNDYGLNLIYVGDAGFSASEALLRRCRLALASVGVFGTDVQILPMTTSALTVKATVTLWSDPGSFNLPAVTYDLEQALLAHFAGRANAFTYQIDAMDGAMGVANAAVQSVEITTPASGVTLTSGSPPTFPDALTRYTLAQTGIDLSFQGP